MKRAGFETYGGHATGKKACIFMTKVAPPPENVFGADRVKGGGEYIISALIVQSVCISKL